MINQLERYKVCLKCPYRVRTGLPQIFMCFRSLAYLNIVQRQESYKCPDNRWSENVVYEKSNTNK